MLGALRPAIADYGRLLHTDDSSAEVVCARYTRTHGGTREPKSGFVAKGEMAMTEGEVVEQLVSFTDTLLVGVSLIFSIVSAYVVALNYFIGSSNFMARFGSFAFITLVLGMLLIVMAGAQSTHAGLVARLVELEAAGRLTAAGRAVLNNATPEWIGMISGDHYSIDSIVNLCAVVGLGFVYLALAYLTFLHHWTPDAIPVSIQDRTP